MSTMTFGQKTFTPTAPEKGSFPLDRKNICRKFMVNYMICLNKNEHRNEECRVQALQYFKCRMDNELMDKTEFEKLGYTAEEIAKHGDIQV